MPRAEGLNPLIKACHLATHLGPAWLAFRLRYALRRRTGGMVRRMPLAEWKPETVPPTPYLTLFQRAPGGIGDGCIQEAESILAGRFRLFSFSQVAAGFPPAWNRNQLSGQEVADDRHWSAVGDFAHGDIKGVWELSRFSWAFTLARAHVRTGAARYAAGFWTLFEDWLDRNPPNRGPNWMCGQEASFRLFSVTFACHVLAQARESTPSRLAQYHEFVRTTGRRIAANLDYALSQSNNHGVSECVGLITAGVLLAGSSEAETWRRVGLEQLRRQLFTLVYPDGGFSQHSANYHRVLLHDLLWLMAVLRQTRAAVPTWLVEAGQRAVKFLDAIMTAETGRVPLYGSNDGANILPLADAEYLDFRPTVQAGYVTFFGMRRLPKGPWDEMADWLGGTSTSVVRDASSGIAPATDLPSPVLGLKGKPQEIPHKTRLTTSEEPITKVHYPDAGCLVWRRDQSRLFLRCPTKFRHRPSQADLLHVDLEWRGEPIAHDAGTYSYNSPGSFRGALKEAAVHNTVTFDGEEPMRKVSRFLYLPWPKGQAEWQAADGCFIASHDGWQRLGVRHARSVQATGAEDWEIRDRVSGSGRHRVRLHWLLADHPHRLDSEASCIVLTTPAGPYRIAWDVSGATVTLVRADAESNRGWWSPYYHCAQPALSLAVDIELETEVTLVTRFGPVC